MLQASTARTALERFLGIDLPDFYGYERSSDHIEKRRRHVSLAEGLALGGYRHYLTEADIDAIRSVTGDVAAEIGYELAGPHKRGHVQ